MSMRYRVSLHDPAVRSFDWVRRPKAAHRLARWLLITLLATAVALALVPWQQTVFGEGQVVAYSPTERPQSIDAPVAGWLAEWFVMEGAHVSAGDPLVRILDNDPELLTRLERERAAARARVDAAEQALTAARSQLNRQRALEKDGLAAQREVEDAQLRLASATRTLASAQAELARAETGVVRQQQQLVAAPRAGIILRRAAGEGSVFVRQGDELAFLVPDTESRAVELWMDGNDLPLLAPGRRVRLQFEGWPALQLAGWPGLAVGTFGGVVSFIDAAGAPRPGSFRVLISPDPEEPWPVPTVLRQGVRAHGWVLLDRVPLGVELWRRFNAFPPRLPEPIELRTPGPPPAGEAGP
jgi:multidrug efflux pump subunit AcrA (membrane-fusion protein)